MRELVCYCFDYSAADIEDEVMANGGHSPILKSIMAEKAAGGCRCATTRPEGR